MNAMVKDVTDASFTADVVERSREIPVLVDLWAPWCGPCRQLGPILERVAQARAGDVELVKLNVDENPEIAGQLNARSIPLVVGFAGGKVAGQFVGLQPESAVMAFIDRLMPSEADRLVALARAEIESGETARAEPKLQAAVELERLHEEAGLLLAALYGDTGRIDEALNLLSRYPATPVNAVGRLMAELRLKTAATSDFSALEAAVSAAPADPAAKIAYGRALAASGQNEQALAQLISAVEMDASFDDGAARKAILDLFGVLRL